MQPNHLVLPPDAMLLETKRWPAETIVASVSVTTATAFE